jgi:hypothetical protein
MPKTLYLLVIRTEYESSTTIDFFLDKEAAEERCKEINEALFADMQARYKEADYSNTKSLALEVKYPTYKECLEYRDSCHVEEVSCSS